MNDFQQAHLLETILPREIQISQLISKVLNLETVFT